MSGFVKTGCHTSFFIDFIGASTAEEVDDRAAVISQKVELYKISAISAIEGEYKRLNFYFPDYNKLIWHTGSNV